MTDTISSDEYNALVAARKAPKYGNQTASVDGIAFDSKAEAAHYRDNLRVRELAGDITDLQLQPRFPLIVNGITISRYTADFSFRDRDGVLHVQDVKSTATKTRDYVMRRKLMKALYGIEIEEVLK